MPKVPTFMYHKDHPNGKQFDLDADDQAELEADGWKDTPAKLKGGDQYEGDDEDDDHEELQSAAPHANNLTRPAGLPLGASTSTVVSVSDDDVNNAPKKPARVRKPKTADGKGKAATKAEQVSGKKESELPPAPADANADAIREAEANGQTNDDGTTAPGTVAPMKAD